MGKNWKKPNCAEKQLLKRELAVKYGSICCYCDYEFDLKDLTLDHLYPVSLQKKWRSRREKNFAKRRNLEYHFKKGNLLLACKPCNQWKDDMIGDVEYFRQIRMGARYTPLKEVERYTPVSREKKESKKARPEKVKSKKNVFFADMKNIKYPDNPLVFRSTPMSRLRQKLKDFISKLKL